MYVPWGVLWGGRVVLAASEERQVALQTTAQLRQRQAAKGRFCLVPLDWLKSACGAHGRGVEVGCVLWFRARADRSKTVRLSRHVILDVIGLDPQAARRALRALEQAGLVRVDRQHGRAPIVEIVHQQCDDLEGDEGRQQKLCRNPPHPLA